MARGGPGLVREEHNEIKSEKGQLSTPLMPAPIQVRLVMGGRTEIFKDGRDNVGKDEDNGDHDEGQTNPEEEWPCQRR